MIEKILPNFLHNFWQFWILNKRLYNMSVINKLWIILEVFVETQKIFNCSQQQICWCYLFPNRSVGNFVKLRHHVIHTHRRFRNIYITLVWNIGKRFKIPPELIPLDLSIILHQEQLCKISNHFIEPFLSYSSKIWFI